MDIDCDGNQDGPGNDGRCDPTGDRQSTTAFEDTIVGYHAGISELNPYVHPYVVFGNDNENNRPGFVSFKPENYGIKPLSVMAVVCGEQLVRPPHPHHLSPNRHLPPPHTFPSFTNPSPRGQIYGIWGDTNGADGSASLVGETSLALATACYGTSVNADNGHDATDVLYVAFKGDKAVPGAKGAKWNAKSYAEFEASIAGLGDSLVGGI